MMLTGAHDDRRSRVPSFDQVIEPFYVLQDAGAELVIVSHQGGDPPYRGARRRSARAVAALERFYGDRRAREAVSDTLRFAQVYPEDFDGGICVGALEHTGGADDGAAVLELIIALLAAGKPVAVVPNDPRLIEQGPLEGILIVGAQARSPQRAAKALLGALNGRARDGA